MTPRSVPVCIAHRDAGARACTRRRFLRHCLAWALAVAACAVAAVPAPALAENAPPRYLDVTARRDGWVLGQSLAVSGSKNNAIVVVSYANPDVTRAFFDLAQRYAQPPHSLPVFGVVRAPHHPQTPNRLDYTVFFNGLPIPTEAEPDRRFTQTEHLDASLRSIGRLHFGWPAARP